MSKKNFKMEDYADMIFGSLTSSKKRERITDKLPIPEHLKGPLKGIWNGGTTNKKKKKS